MQKNEIKSGVTIDPFIVVMKSLSLNTYIITIITFIYKKCKEYVVKK